MLEHISRGQVEVLCARVTSTGLGAFPHFPQSVLSGEVSLFFFSRQNLKSPQILVAPSSHGRGRCSG